MILYLCSSIAIVVTHTIILIMEFPVWVLFENEWWTTSLFCIVILASICIGEVLIKNNHISFYSSRNIIHMLVGVYISASPLLFKSNFYPIVLASIFIFLNYLSFKYKIFKSMLSPHRITYGTIYFPIAYIIMVVGFWNYPEYLMISLLVLSFSDPLASQVGNSIKSPIYFKIWDDKKSIQGTITFFISTFFLVLISSYIFFNYSIYLITVFAIFVSIGGTIAEITSTRGTDNLSVPILCILFMIGFFEIVTDPQNITFYSLSFDKIITIILIVFIFLISTYLKALTYSGLFGAIVMGILVTLFGSLHYLIPLSVFFIFSSFLSKILKSSFYKIKGSQRDIIQVYANGGVALILCLVNYFTPNPLILLLFLASVSSAMSDTWGTEFGKLSKSRPVSILTFKSIEHGLSGGITRIGTIGSLLGSCVLGFTIWIITPIPSYLIYGIILSGFAGSIFDSIIGASHQGKYQTNSGEIIEENLENTTIVSGKTWITNNLVNLLNTIVGPVFMSAYVYIMSLL
mgnify:FL=1